MARPHGTNVKSGNIDWERVQFLYGLGCTDKDVCLTLKIDEKTLYKNKKKQELAKGKGIAELQTSLKSKLVNKALDENDTTSLIFALKNYCGFSDKKEIDQTNQSKITIVNNENEEIETID